MGAELIVPGGGSAPSGTGIVRAAGGAFVDPATPLGATDILAAIAGIAINCGTSTGTANALAIASAVDVATSFTAGRFYLAKANLANSGATTAALNGGTGGSILPIRKNPNSAALVGGEIAANAWVLLYCDGTYLQLMAGRSLLPGDLGTGTPGANKFLDGLGAWRALVPGDMPVATRYEAQKTAGQSASSGNLLTFDSPSTNDGDWTRTDADTLTCNTSRWYNISIVVYAASATLASIEAQRNGTTVRSGGLATMQANPSFKDFVYYAAGDTLELAIFPQSSVTPDNLSGDARVKLYIVGCNER